MKNKNHNRRDFFRTLLRVTALTGLAAVSAVVTVLRNPKPQTNRQSCINQGLCKNCSAFKNCELPTALSIKSKGIKTFN
ncbi:MAG: hypothetical protein JXD22_16065 [Sedimentisphaerales bacterium]|nr:hypothetical protein [Sedimentisphaerales bacterium]